MMKFPKSLLVICVVQKRSERLSCPHQSLRVFLSHWERIEVRVSSKRDA